MSQMIMSTISDIGYSLSNKVLTKKLTIEERAEVFFDILSDLSWIGDSISCIDDAILYLQRIDNETKATTKICLECEEPAFCGGKCAAHCDCVA